MSDISIIAMSVIFLIIPLGTVVPRPKVLVDGIQSATRVIESVFSFKINPQLQTRGGGSRSSMSSCSYQPV